MAACCFLAFCCACLIAFFFSFSVIGWFVAKGCWGVAASCSGLASGLAALAVADTFPAGRIARASGRLSISLVSLTVEAVTSDPTPLVAPGAAVPGTWGTLAGIVGRRLVMAGEPALAACAVSGRPRKASST